MGAILGFFGGFWGKLLVGAVILAALAGAYFAWKKGVENAAMLKFNQKQLELVIRDQQKYNKLVEELKNKQIEAIRDANKAKEELEQKYEDVEDFLKAIENTDKDKPSSDILKETIDRLREGNND